MKYLILLLSFNAFGNCDLYKGSEIRTEMCYYVPLTFVKVELMDEFRDLEKYPNSRWVVRAFANNNKPTKDTLIFELEKELTFKDCRKCIDEFIERAE